MSKIGAAFLIALWLAAGSAAAAEVTVPHHVTHGAAWGCSDKNELIDLLFLGLSASFDDKLAGSCQRQMRLFQLRRDRDDPQG